MKLSKITIENFRRIEKAEITLDSASFIIGPNNCGKTSVIDAIDALLSLKSEKLTEGDFRQKADGTRCQTIKLTGVFTNISPEVAQSRGFKGRIINGQFTYSKTYHLVAASKPEIESITYPFTIDEKFAKAKTIQDLLNLGIAEDTIKQSFDKTAPEEKLPKGWEKSLPEILNFDTTKDPISEKNPGGFPSNVISKLPKVIRIPSLMNLQEIENSDKKYILGECLSILFEDLLSQTTLAAEIQEKLDKLESEMSPQNQNSLIKKLTKEVNTIVSSVFPNCGIEITPDLQNLTDILKPKYEINLYSNVTTKIDRQGTGLIRTTVFAMLRYHSNLKSQKNLETRPILVAFEEPEIFLHPAAANLLRETIYALGQTDQIVCNTHSPWMIDLTQSPLSLTKMSFTVQGTVECINYGLTSSFLKLEADDKSRVKMLQVFDDELARVFFSERVIIVEGDTEYLTIRNTIRVAGPEERRKILSSSHVVKARGKASIISLTKYLQDLGIKPYVMHDRDQGIAGAEKFNGPIANAVNDATRLVLNEENIEDSLGYAAPASDKPFTAFINTSDWKTIADIPQKWKEKFEFIFVDILN